jgi:hypothetical protein
MRVGLGDPHALNYFVGILNDGPANYKDARSNGRLHANESQVGDCEL